MTGEEPRSPLPRPVVLVVMGVAGCGKTTVAEHLVDRLGWPFQEGDALHPPANVAKMTAGQPLDDEDRRPWLDEVASWIEGCLDRDADGIITCSALKRVYRDRLNRRGSGVLFVHLSADPDTLSARLGAREGHFMPQSLLQSQLATLEEPAADEPAIRVDVSGTPEEAAEEIVERLGLSSLDEPARG